MSPEAVKSLIFAVVAAAIFFAGWAVEGWRKSAEISRLETAHANAVTKEATKNAAVLEEAQARGDQLALSLAARESTLTIFAEEKNREIAKLTSGRRCLDADAVRVLNTPNGAGRVGGLASPATGVVLRTDAAIAAPADDGTFASDTDVAGWIGLCQRSYDTCRGRLDAIADFYNKGASGER